MLGRYIKSVGMKKRMEKITVIAKGTNSCNLACKYCYADDSSEKGFMTDETLENMIEKTGDIHDNVDIIWHGGEPLLLPLKFYRKAVELQKKVDAKFKNSIQTNGTRVTNEIFEFCKENNFGMGFSLDGPKELHDLTRPYKKGGSSFDKTLKAVKKAKELGLGGGIIVVLNKFNISKLNEIYEFANENQINLKLNPLINAGKACSNMDDLGIGPIKYGEALVKLFDRWFEEDTSLRISPFNEYLNSFLTGKPGECTYSKSCQERYIAIAPDGEIYPCGRFDGVQEFYLGNINTDNLEEVLYSDKRVHLQKRVERVEGCEPCEYNSICNSGCLHNAYTSTGNIDDKDFYCESYKLLFDKIKNVVNNEIEKAEA
jgi:uncharacterized protein